MRNKEFLNFLKSAMLKEREVTSDRIKAAMKDVADTVKQHFTDLKTDLGVLEADVRRALEEEQVKIHNKLAEVKDGEKGERGEQGEAGQAGDTGLQGEAGQAGERGEAGEAGPPGADGERGLPGAAGRDGVDGIAGKDGAPGSDGVPGVDGRPGADGAAGVDRLILSPRTVDANVQLEKNEIVECNGGLYQSTRKTTGDPNKDPGSYKLVVNGIAKIDRVYDEEGGGSNITVRMSDGSVCEFGVLDGADGKDGEKGEQGGRGRKGIKGDPGEKGDTGVGLEDIMSHEGQLVFVLTDGTHKTVNLKDLI